MGQKTGIEWTESTWNPIRGCSRVSEGCRNCYAETVANRFKGPGEPYEGLIAKGGQWNGEVKLVEHKLDEPCRWSKPRMIFVNSMSDLFHENVDFETIHRVMLVMQKAQHHTFQVLTKRPERMLRFFKWWGGECERSFPEVMPNVWLGVSVEDQATADERIPLLLDTPAAVRWISAEPLLGPVDLSSLPYPCKVKGNIHWVVVGGESGRNARPMHPDWARSIRDQCQTAGVPFLFKQWGEWLPVLGQSEGVPIWGKKHSFEDGTFMGWVGKKDAGRSLDGRTWDQYPEAPQ
ncbi:phage Gp37/Gp68 family protein [Marinobacter adhaerens]|uniref:DUF5131 family protein n=1 Tax=Marinobacter adhaerens TaxID=1033846 RepID=UPI001C5FA720|nr:phage Gp37/Gp68 family protein [Marinobacter adhaerens]MBW4978299.1 phage Gp37/Gp68 family protein [Marinobacter adhaerens]